MAEITPETPQKQNGWHKIGEALWELVSSFLIAAILALLIVFFVAQTAKVEGISMLPNFHNNERIVVEKISYDQHPPQRGDVIVVKSPLDSNTRLIKRVIGLPGETIAVHDGLVFINSKPLMEPYLNQDTNGYLAPQRVPPLHYFIMGDNRNMSLDSRMFGPVDRDAIIGRVWISYWPPADIGLISK